ncbi:hypothetical protein F2Q69_00029591 [Brassica cretica]|uniref:Uncharacterized protein n=1 Tax=Brassica cretica TaxID=69181 RepID=A0A8S9RUK2_BRACR|nr:hypothetical protein F2Q69_00029591 [Brassica cretica]
MIIFGNLTFIHGNLTFILSYEPSINRHKVYGLLVKKSNKEWLNCGLWEISLDENAWIRVASTFGRVRSLHGDRAVCVLGRYVATELSDRAERPSRATEPSDRAWLELGRYVATELGLCVVRWPYLRLSAADLDTCLLPPDNRYLVVRLRLEQDFTARLFVKILFTKNNFRKKCLR